MHSDRYSSVFSQATLWASCLFAVILGFSRLSYGLLLPGIQRSLGGSYSLLGGVGTLNFIGYLAGTLLLPFILPRFPRRRPEMTLLSCLALGVTMLASASSTSLLQLGVWRFAIGLFSAFATVLVLSQTLDRIQPEQRGLASGLIWLGGSAGIVITGVPAPWLIDPAHTAAWRIAWVLMGAFGIAAAIGFQSVLRRHPLVPRISTGEQPGGRSKAAAQAAGPSVAKRRSLLRVVFHPKEQLFLSGAYFLFGWGYIVYFTYLIPYLTEQGIPSFYSGLVWAVIGLAGLFNGLLGGKAIDRWPSGYTLAAGLALGSAGVLGVLAYSLPLTLIGGAVLGLTSFLSPPVMTSALLRRTVPGESYSEALSVLTALFASGQIIGPLVGAWMADRMELRISVASGAWFMLAAAALAALYGAVRHEENENASAPARETRSSNGGI